jgi:hypothetical protein
MKTYKKLVTVIAFVAVLVSNFVFGAEDHVELEPAIRDVAILVLRYGDRCKAFDYVYEIVSDTARPAHEAQKEAEKKDLIETMFGKEAVRDNLIEKVRMVLNYAETVVAKREERIKTRTEVSKKEDDEYRQIIAYTLEVKKVFTYYSCYYHIASAVDSSEAASILLGRGECVANILDLAQGLVRRTASFFVIQ